MYSFAHRIIQNIICLNMEVHRYLTFVVWECKILRFTLIVGDPDKFKMTSHYRVSTGNYSCIIGKFRFKRKVTYYLMQTYLPTGLFVSLSWISFWIDEAHIGARITLGMLTVLTTTAQGNLISKNLPRLSYIKAIDVWMSVCDQLRLCWLLNVRTCKVTS